MPATAEPSPLGIPELIELPALAERFGVTDRTIREWVRNGTIPAPTMLGRRPVWTAATIRRFLDGEHPPGAAQ